ncbi:zinc finger protein 366 [Kryptolebias marmoratus]|uniref:Zinc finger protein 710 n=1 Tax=Kryptolebias marmoratus TaxID=37003 RepID=A0A3Q3EER7_KRYMA|nr:zinc finger protein 366 [Kryptolebias marmoratus]XP_017267611.1 zinc finger protein 366 [Kryptolebias marmoratus]XP_037835858.1 zinc finger protein 366 [Kryptolebias marmoratus]
MEKDSVNLSPGGSPLRDRLRQTPQHSFYLGPAPLYIKPPRFSPPSYPTMSPSTDTYGAFSRPAFFPMPGFGYAQKERSQKQKRAPLKKDPHGGESPDREEEEAEESSSKKTPDLTHFPFSLPPRSVSSLPSKPIPGMIELNRLQLHHRSPALNLPMQVKQEPPSPSSLWAPSPLLLHPPYFPPLPHSPFPYPFFMPGPVMHLPPGAFYPREGRLSSQPAPDEASRSGGTNPEKLGINIHVDDSYYVDVGGDQKRWKCRMCEKSYTSKYNLVTHILGHNGIKPHGCHLCGKLFKQLSHLHTHLLTHQGMRPHKCQVCHKAFTQTSHLKRHMMQHSDVKPYSCSVCGRGFAYPSELRAHELKHEKGQENVCVECGLDFPTLAQLKRHLTVHRGPTLYRCTECQKTFQYPSQLQNHMMKHKDIRPYICSECGMEFIQSHHLKQHTLTHKGVKEHKCRICGREFTLLANMKRHVLIHTNIRAYQCHVCFKSFVQKQTLKAHMIVHSDIKPYKCKLCGKEFNRMHNLMGHMHLHSDSKPFKCLYCPSKFTLKGNLTRHMKVKHGVMDRGLDERLFRQRGRYCLSTPMGLLSPFSQEEPFDLSQKASGLPSLRLSQSDGESVPGSSCQEEDEESLYRRSQYSPEVDQQEPGGEDQYIPEGKEGGQERTDELRPREMMKLQKYQKRSVDESSDGEMAEDRQSVGLRGNQEQRLLQSETSYESDAEADEECETGCGRSYDSDSVSDGQEQEREEQEQSVANRPRS